ncbi:hypothetical protein [Shouchella clausii]|uniref:Uncharacterized protein n=1 Tax=Shouchella clausii TaxID=79880 RepID=A0A268NVT3_SHOCL|nr:hypothetical protein [Shouchella clausii]PAE87637.1 hypothetical protein CHH72_17275 [Shouchella clausii]
MLVKVDFISVWNSGFEVETKATLNTQTNELTEILSYEGELIDAEGDELEHFEGQYIEFAGKRFSVEETNGKYIANVPKNDI